MEYVIKKCLGCGSLVRVLTDCKCEGCGIRCCDKEMVELKPNTFDASFEKHIPTYEVNGDKIIVKVNHVMESDHYIEWISVVNDNNEYVTYFKEGSDPIVEFDYIPGSRIYSYCNKHGLWMTEVE